MSLLITEQTLEAALADARTELAKAEAARATAETRVLQLRTEVAGLEAAVARRQLAAVAAVSPPGLPALGVSIPTLDFSRLTPPVDPAVAGVAALVLILMAAHHDWATKKRATAVELVLRSASRPLHRLGITETLQRVGRPKENLRDVSAALAYLHRSGRAKPIGDGIWVHVDFADRYLKVID